MSLQREDEFSVGLMLKERVTAASFTGTAEIYPRPIAVRLKEAVIDDRFELEHLGPPSRVRGFTGYPEGTLSFVECYDYHTVDQLLVELTPVVRRLIATPNDWETGEPVDPMIQARYVRAIAALPLTPETIVLRGPGACPQP